MQGTMPELIAIPASVELEGKTLVWAFSKKQLDMVLQDIVVKSSENTGVQCVSRTEWQDLELPIVSFEKYFGLKQKETSVVPKYCVVKGAYTQVGSPVLVRIAIELQSNIKILHCNIECAPVSADILPKRNSDILGAFGLKAGVTMIVPDIAKIWENTNMGIYPE